MRLISTAEGKKALEMTKEEWEKMGSDAGWLQKEARFGAYMEGAGKQVWENWKSQGYSSGNPPAFEDAAEFVKFVETLADVGQDQLMPTDEEHQFLWNRLNKIKSSGGDAIAKALQYQVAFHEIEKAGVFDSAWFDKLEEKQKARTPFA